MNADLFNGKGVVAHQEIPGLLRPFDVINDLRWLHGCLDDPRHATNLVLDRSGKRLIHHCLQLLHAHDAQAFIYELYHQQVIQFD